MPLNSGRRSRVGLSVRRANLDPSEVVVVRGFRVTSIERTLSDLSEQLPAVEALVLVDAALHLKRIDKETLNRTSYPSLRALAPLAEPAESPMETRLRWLLLKAGLPRPEVQRDLYDDAGQLIGRADLYYPDARLIVEFDGDNHRDRLIEDNRRQNLLLQAGYRLLRFTSSDVYNRPGVIASLVRAALSGRVGASSTRRAAAQR